MIAHFDGRIGLGIEAVHLVKEQRGTVIWAILIQIIGEPDKLFQFALGMYFTNFKRHIVSFKVEHRGLEPLTLTLRTLRSTR